MMNIRFLYSRHEAPCLRRRKQLSDFVQESSRSKGSRGASLSRLSYPTVTEGLAPGSVVDQAGSEKPGV